MRPDPIVNRIMLIDGMTICCQRWIKDWNECSMISSALYLYKFSDTDKWHDEKMREMREKKTIEVRKIDTRLGSF